MEKLHGCSDGLADPGVPLFIKVITKKVIKNQVMYCGKNS